MWKKRHTIASRRHPQYRADTCANNIRLLCMPSVRKINAMKQRQQQRNKRNKRSKKEKRKENKNHHIHITYHRELNSATFFLLGHSTNSKRTRHTHTYSHKRISSFLHLVRSLSCVYGSASSSTVAVVTILSGWITRVSTHRVNACLNHWLCVFARVVVLLHKNRSGRCCPMVCVSVFIFSFFSYGICCTRKNKKTDDDDTLDESTPHKTIIHTTAEST